MKVTHKINPIPKPKDTTEVTNLLQSTKVLHFEKLSVIKEANGLLKYNSRYQSRSYPNGNSVIVFSE